MAGYNAGDPDRVIRDIREQLLPLDAELIGPVEYGTKYRIRGMLRGPNGRELRVVSIWITLEATGITRFLTLISGQAVKYPLYSRIALAEDLPQENLRRGDVATIIEHYEGRPGQEPGYELEVFNAVGDTIAVVTVRESQIEALRSNEILNVRQRESAAA